MDVIEVTENKAAICRRILDALPQWFGIEDSKDVYARAARDLPMFACMRGGEAVGFLTLLVHNVFAAEIQVIGVLPNWHRRGLGKCLVQRAEGFAAESGLRFLTVKTLAPSNPDENYAKTRLFYEAVGFVPLEELPNLWGPENPCLMLVKPITAARLPPASG